MAVPKKKTSKPRTHMRRSHDRLSVPGQSTCATCGATKAPHRVCPDCGHYRGRQIFQVEREDEV